MGKYSSSVISTSTTSGTATPIQPGAATTAQHHASIAGSAQRETMSAGEVEGVLIPFANSLS
jgi:hypothetical protein